VAALSEHGEEWGQMERFVGFIFFVVIAAGVIFVMLVGSAFAAAFPGVLGLVGIVLLVLWSLWRASK
jgi:hypothetical protein